jgi:aminopeptidase-like protein
VSEHDREERSFERASLESTFDRLWPLHRSITGAGLRASLDILEETVPLRRTEVASGTRVFDWTVPKEWQVRAAYLEAPDGSRIVDVGDHTLHLVGYSVPFRGVLGREELDRHLYSLPEQPDAIPYVTSYYQPRWGFCLPHRLRTALPEGNYRVVVDTELMDGSMTLADVLLPGDSADEVLLSTYLCHPSMANNELSGPLVAAQLYRRLAAWPRRRYSYRFVFVPETIGTIAYLSLHGEALRRQLRAGYVLTCLGDRGPFTYKRSRSAPTLADRAAETVLRDLEPDARAVDFVPMGSDERQYGSPGFDLPVGSLMRTMYGHYPEYHTSLDDRRFISFEALQRSIDIYEQVCGALEANVRYRSLAPYGEPRLGDRGLYPTAMVGASNVGTAEAILWLLNLADGDHDLLAVAERSGLTLAALTGAASRLLEAGLIAAEPGSAIR